MQRRRRFGRGIFLLTLTVAVWLLGEWVLVLGPDNPVRNLTGRAETTLYDLHQSDLPRETPDSRIVIVAMDDATLGHLPGLDRPFYPLPRAYHARLVDALAQAGAKTIGFDVMFPVEREGDDAFAAALIRHGNVVAAATPESVLQDGQEHVTFTPPAPALRPYLFPASISVPRGMIRWISPYRADDARPGVRYPHFGLALAAAYHDDANRIEPVLRDTFHWGAYVDAPVAAIGPPNDEAQLLVRYVGPKKTFPIVPYWQVITGEWKRDHPPGFFRGKIVLVGRVHSQEDMQLTPRGEMPGVEVHANIVQMALTNRYLRRAPEQAALGVGIAFLVVYGLVLWRFTLAPAALAALVMAGFWGGIPALWAGVPRWVFVQQGIWLDTLPPLLLLGTQLLLTGVYEGFQMRRAFGAFLPAWAADRALRGRVETADGLERPVTVVFCDIRDFTTIAEQYPQEAVELLRRFYEAADTAARKQGTELDKFIGDEIMLYFRDTRRGPSHALRAVRWAQGMMEAVQEIDAEGLIDDLSFRVGIGIASGLAREGFIGTRRRRQFTVIGDVVNLASRLQDATKTFKHPVLLSEQTFSQAGDDISAEPLGVIPVKGKQERVSVYALQIPMRNAPAESKATAL